MPPAPTTLRVGVRDLCEFTARVGDLDVRFGMSPNAREGVAGHETVTSRRSDTYQREVALKGAHNELLVTGRADGYDPERRRLEEIKTFRGDLSRQPETQRQLHWAQLKAYGWLLCERDTLASITLALVYFNIDSELEYAFDVTVSASELRAHFVELCSRYANWATQEHAHRMRRDVHLTQLTFPHSAFRPGQRELAEAVFRTARSGGCLLAEAPTGIGKSIATLFPMLKAMPVRALDKIYFLSAKTSGRQLALDALARCQAPPSRAAIGPGLDEQREEPESCEPRLRVVQLIAKAKACLHPGQACTGETCPLARGYFDRLPAARAEWAVSDSADAFAVSVVAERHQICPYYFAQDLVRWADVVVADYNYYFDTSASLYSAMIDSEWRVGVLVDEAHNLIDRARSMYSASLQLAQIKALRREVPALTRTWNRLIRHWRELKLPEDRAYQVLEQPPLCFLKALSTSSTEIGSYLVDNAETASSLRDFYLAALHFLRRSESFDENSVYDVNRAAVRTASYSAKQIGTNKANSDTEVMLRNVVPAPYIGPRLAAADSVVLFSATLTPIDFYRGMLGVAEDARVAQVPSPFSSDQLLITVSRHISTRYKDRRASLDAITQLIADQHRQCPGNYLAFFSSFEYLELAANDLRERFPQLIQWRQTREMSEAAREEFVESFVEGGEGIGFAVLGGAFGEGIDLPGTKLIGAFIATLGLPPTDPINETYREVIDRKFGCGYDYTFTYPGIRKVVQASGRVIRTLSDQGILHLMDDRFASPAVQRLLPAWWLMNVARHPRRD